MKVSVDSIREHYARLGSRELLEIRKEDLTEEAGKAFEEELERRALSREKRNFDEKLRLEEEERREKIAKEAAREMAERSGRSVPWTPGEVFGGSAILLGLALLADHFLGWAPRQVFVWGWLLFFVSGSVWLLMSTFRLFRFLAGRLKRSDGRKGLARLDTVARRLGFLVFLAGIALMLFSVLEYFNSYSPYSRHFLDPDDSHFPWLMWGLGTVAAGMLVMTGATDRLASWVRHGSKPKP